VWDLPTADALMLERLMRSGDADSAIEQGWLLVALRTEFGLCLDELARRFDRSKSWVSRRLALVEMLPDVVQQRVRQGILAPHAAMKFLVPLARANKDECEALATAFTHPLSIRQVEALCGVYKTADPQTRARLREDPDLFLRAIEAARHPEPEPLLPGERLLRDAGAMGGIARRLSKHLREGHARGLPAKDQDELSRALTQARLDSERLFQLADKELTDARPQHPPGHSASA
jgi:ParB family chromosome partitioning protein